MDNGFDLSNPPYEIKSAGSKGLGMFATRPLQVGDLILVERPLVVMPMNPDLSAVKDCSEVVRYYSAMSKGNSTFEGVIDALMSGIFTRMKKEDQDAFSALHQTHNRDNENMNISSIFSTNAYEFEVWSTPKGEEKDLYGAVPKGMSRLNHSCRPNCAHNFTPDSFTFELRATKPIDAGEEIVYSYCDPCQPTSTRKEYLKKHYGFTCSRSACLPSHTQQCDDSIRTSIPTRMWALEAAALSEAARNKDDYDEMLKIHEISASLVRDMEQVGLDGHYAWYKDAMVVCHSSCAFIRDITQKSAKYSALDRWRWAREELKYRKVMLPVVLAVEGSNGMRKDAPSN